MVEAAKPWWESKAQVGTVASAASVIIGGAAGIAIHPDLIEYALPIVIPAVLSLISNAVAMWGNFTRKRPIDTKAILPGVTTDKVKRALHMVAGGD